MNIIFNIKGLKFKIGQNVKVVTLSDQHGNKKYVGVMGKVMYFNYDCGCGQSYPYDPMIGVQFKDKKVAEYWNEELEIIGLGT